ncbi:MAG: putative nucleotidyltransferase [Microgenomates group bacterium Gr01-1014_7]|nr:MAG: putative nucleotidyltransferase [Microgenomates group bacterium Gr01-1014_7]
MKNIRGKIINKLKEIEDKKQVKILYAVESGSRGWGFESEDSDYDIRFIYAHPLDWYLSIENKKDVIELPIIDKLDISGWDIKKALKLFKNSNPPLYEWLKSPIIYLEEGEFAQRLRALMPKFYSPISSIHH